MIHSGYAIELDPEARKGFNRESYREKAWCDKCVEAGRLMLNVISTTVSPLATGTFPGFPGNTNNQEADLFFIFLRLYESCHHHGSKSCCCEHQLRFR